METFTFNYKTKVEQFKEQFPELYQEIYNLGYIQGCGDNHYSDDNYEEPWYPEPEDDSERFYMYSNWNTIYEKAQDLEFEGYKAGNKDWPRFMISYDGQDMYIAWNPTHKLFAVESDDCTINELYPHLVNPTHVKDSLPK